MAILPYPKSRRRKTAAAASTALVSVPAAPPSAALINAILTYADVQEDIGAGLCLLRVSAHRLDDAVIRATLGREASRLLDISLIWNEEESEIHSVLDAATPLGVEAADPPHGDPQFELTPLALAYLEAWSQDEAALAG